SYDPSVRERRAEMALASVGGAPADRDEQPAPPRLLVTNGGDDLAEVTLDRPRLVLGRDEACDITFESAYLSRYQSLFMETSSGWLLIDLNSTNGSFVNGRRVREHALRDGDLIAIGQYQLRFVWPDGDGRTPAERPGEDTAVSPKPAIGKSA
ncbi:MAG TPA: FHA domain-containing protein, partial [Gammaproteobacteria bacterium]|nr:FHA domain-containing protein [Gammaproteobacteria bacterium]